MELMLVLVLLRVGVSQESHFEYFSEGEATVLYELGEEERFLQTMQTGMELVFGEDPADPQW